MPPPTAAQEDRRLARRALNKTDELLGELEELLLHDCAEVPAWCRNRAAAARTAAIAAGLRDPQFETGTGVIKMMDDVYALLHSSQIVGGRNYAAFRDSSVDQWLEAGRSWPRSLASWPWKPLSDNDNYR